MTQKTKYIINFSLWTVISTILSGTIMQTFLLEKGTSTENVSLFLSIMQLTQMVVIFAFSPIVDKIKNIIRTTALDFLLYIPFMTLLLIYCFIADSNMIVICGLGIVANAAIGFYNVLGYKIPYHVMDIRDYGKWTGAAGIPASIVAMIFSLTLTAIQKAFGFFPAMRFVYAFGILCSSAFVLITLSYKKVETNHVDAPKKKINILKYKPFTILILPNLLRGFAAGILGMAVTIGYTTGQVDDSAALIMLTISQVVSIVAYALYTRLSGKENILLLVCSGVMLVSLPLMIVYNTMSFLIIYGVAYFAISIVNVSVPVEVTKIIDYDIAGQYNGWRMLLNSLGQFIATSVCVVLMNAVSPLFVLLIAGFCQFASGLIYYIYCKREENTLSTTKNN